jgi:hypothetical protein
VTVFVSVILIFLEITAYTFSKQWTATPNLFLSAWTCILGALTSLFMMPSFWIAIYVMTPSNFEAAEERRSAFRTFLRGGFDNFAQLQAAMI